MSRRWLQQSERGSPWALRLIRWIALRLGRAPARLLLHPITLYFLITGRRGRRASRQFLSAALGRRAGIVDIYRHLHTFAATILDRVYFLTGQFQRFEISRSGWETVKALMERRQGCILLGSHLGSFECLRAVGVNVDMSPIKVLMHHDHNQLITSLLEALNPDVAATVIPLGKPDTLLRAKEWLDGGGILGLLGDRVDTSDKQVRCRFLGHDTVFPAGPILLAGALKVPVILFFGIYRGGNRYHIHFEPFAERIELSRAEREQQVRQWTQRYAQRLEYHARQAPYNWFNFYEYWDDDTAC